MIDCIVMTTDLMAEVRVLEALRADGLTARSSGPEEWAAEMAAVPTDPSEAAMPATVGIVDLTTAGAIAAIGRAAEAGVPVLAYGPHVDGESLAAARAAGATAVYPRGRFLMQTAALVRGLVAEDEAEGGLTDDPA